MAEDKNITIVIDEDAPLDAAAVTDEVVAEADEQPVEGLPRGARLRTDGTVSLSLAAPVSITVKRDGKISSVSYDTLTFRRFNGADLRAIRQLSGDAQTVEMFARATGIHNARMAALYGRMDAYDITRAGEVIEYFFENGPTTGR